MNKIPQLRRKTFKMSDHGYKEELFIVRYPTKEEHTVKIPTHALLNKTFIVLKNWPYICFGQLTGQPQGQLTFKAQSRS
jgi:hypothetical protein